MAFVILFSFNCRSQFPTTNLDRPDRNFTQKDGLLANTVYGCLQDKQGFMWFYTARGISRYDGHKFRNFTIEDGLPTNDIWLLSLDSLNRIWVHCFDRSLYYIDHDKVIKAADLPGLYTIYMLTSDGAGNIYCNEPPLKFRLLKEDNNYRYISESPGMVEKGGPSTYEINNWVFDYASKKDTVTFTNSKTGVTSLLGLHEKGMFHSPVVFHNQVYISYSSGLYVFGTNDIAAHYVFNQKQSNNRSFIDKDHNIWLTTKDRGVFLFKSSNQSRARTSTPNATHLTRSIPYDKLNLFVDEQNNILDLNNDNMNFVSKFNIIGVRSVCPFFDSTNIVFTDAGIFIADDSKRSSTVKPKDFQSAISSASNIFTPSKMWKLGVDSFISLYLGRSCDLVTMENGALHATALHKETERLQTLFIDENKNIFVFSKFNIYKYTGIGQLPDTIALQYKGRPIAVTCIVQHPHTKEIWIGTDGQGLFRLNGNNFVNVLENKKINKLVFNKDKFIFSTDDGIFVYQNTRNRHNLKFAYTARDGVYTDELLDIRINDGKLYAISKSEILHLDLENKNQKKDTLIFYSFMADSTLYEKYTSMVVPASYNQISVQFSLFNYDYVDEVKYYYTLNDTARWIGVETNNINLQGLGGGRYNMQVKAIDKVTGMELARNELQFLIAIPWWRSRAFIIIANMLMWAGIYYYYRNRFKKKAERENKIVALEFSMKELKLKALEAQMNPHFIYNSLSSIQHYIQENMKDEAEYFLTSFSKLVRSYLEATRKPMINLDEEVELLHRYLSLEKVRYEDKFEFDLTVDPGLDRKNIFINTMLLQPFVENALQHGLFHRPQGGLLHIDFKKENTNLHVTLTDNGIGIDKSIELKKANTKIISSRAMEIFYEKLEIINKINPDSISFSYRNLDNNHPEYKGTVVNIIFNNVCS